MNSATLGAVLTNSARLFHSLGAGYCKSSGTNRRWHSYDRSDPLSI